MKPISDIARNQSERKYVTPDIIRDVELQLSVHLLDKAFRDSVKAGVVLENIGQVSYNCSGYELLRIFIVNGNQITIEDRSKTTSYRAVFDGLPSQVITSERTLQKSTESLEKFRKRFELIRSLKA